MTTVQADPVAVAAVNGTVITIYEVVLAAFLRQSTTALSTLLGAAEDVSSMLRFPLENCAARLQGKPWSQYKTDANVHDFHQKRLQELLTLSAQRQPPTPSEGEEFIDTIISIAVQYPFATLISRLPNGNIGFGQPRLPDLGRPGAIRRWIRLIETLRLLPIRPSPIRRVDALIEAAESAREGSRDNLAIVMQYMEEVGKEASDLHTRLEYWQARRLSGRNRAIIVAGFIGGAAIFVAGVLVPLVLRDSAPYWLYSYVPAMWYLLVLAVAVVAVTGRAIRA